MNKNKQVKQPKLHRFIAAEVRALDAAADGKRSYVLSASSSAPVERAAWGEVFREVLDHAPDAIDLSRVDGMPVLLEHDRAQQIGVVEQLEVRDGKTYAQVRFSSQGRGAEIEADVADGIRRNVSIGYVVREYMYDGADEAGVPLYRAVDWMPTEISIVSVASDPTVGVGRADGAVEHTAVITGLPEAAPADPAPAPAQEQQEEPQAAATTSASDAAATADNVDANNEAAPQAPESKETSESARAAVKDNAQALADIVALTKAHGMAERAAEFIQQGLTLEQVRKAIIEQKRSHPLNNRETTMDQKDKQRYSVTRALRIALNEETGGLEAEMHQELARNLPKGYAAKGGASIFIPLATGERALDSKTAGGASELIFTQAGELIDMLRSASIAMRLGARNYFGLEGPVSFPKIAGGATAEWRSENPGSDGNSSQFITGSVGLVPKTLQGTTAFSRQLLRQSVIGIEQAVRTELMAAHALAIDKAVFHGEGVDEPLGIYNAPGVSIVDMTDGISHGKLVEMITKAFKSNALLGSLGFAMTAEVAGKLAQTLVAQAAGSGFIWSGRLDDGTVNGYQAVASNQLASDLGDLADEHGLIFGNFADVMIGGWGGVEVLVDELSLKKQGLIEVTTFQMADVALRHPESFVKALKLKV